MDEVDDKRPSQGKGDENNQPEGMGFAIERKLIVLEVHPVGRKDHGRNGHDNGNEGQGLHDVVLVVGDDRCEGIGHGVEDVSINIRHLDGLLGLDQGIFQQILIFQVFLDVTSSAGQFLDHALIGFQ